MFSKKEENMDEIIGKGPLVGSAMVLRAHKIVPTEFWAYLFRKILPLNAEKSEEVLFLRLDITRTFIQGQTILT